MNNSLTQFNGVTLIFVYYQNICSYNIRKGGSIDEWIAGESMRNRRGT